MLVLLTFLVCLAGGAIPLIAADLFVVGAGTIATHAQLPALILAATIAQIGGKMLTYAAGARSLATSTYALQLDRSTRLSRYRDGVVFLSALSGLPPFFAVAFACGAYGPRFRGFWWRHCRGA